MGPVAEGAGIRIAAAPLVGSAAGGAAEVAVETAGARLQQSLRAPLVGVPEPSLRHVCQRVVSPHSRGPRARGRRGAVGLVLLVGAHWLQVLLLLRGGRHDGKTRPAAAELLLVGEIGASLLLRVLLTSAAAKAVRGVGTLKKSVYLVGTLHSVCLFVFFIVCLVWYVSSLFLSVTFFFFFNG